ncbi:alanine--tRNA ligase, partial [Rothia mucilaginosa]|uniref:alanine--tRNA ligase n=1 Tax=Rothia mucilaginosa TaxID=43675 RepID=UPI0028DD3079
MLSQEISKRWIDFFASRGHTVVPSASLISNEPGAMFTIAGMVPFIPYFLGRETPPFSRATSVQKCIRTLDIEEVGKTARHGTFFQMAGNFSFGDYFKEQAIPFAYELLTTPQDKGGFGLDPERLWVTIYEGDDEAFDIWHNKVGFPAERIQRMGMKENYWSTGQPGPAGPDSEIFYDRGPAYGKEGGPAADDDRYIEIWNLVFMQYNRKADGSLEGLPHKVIDTGMGFERLVRVLQGKNSNYDTDIFQPIIRKIAEFSGFAYGKEEATDVAMRVIADHLRAIAFSIADGQLPSNAKAGYVIRRILRRAVRYAYTFLNQREAFICRLIPTLVQEMGAAYPELPAQQDLIPKVIREEEESFLRTLATGINRLENIIEATKAAGNKVVEGKEAFTLFDTYGFPFDLTELICSEAGLTVDEAGFDAEMQQQKERARNAAATETGDWVVLAEGDTTFHGWDYTEYGCRILKYRQVQQKKQTYFELVLDNTPFYAEMGGQVGDTGVL